MSQESNALHKSLKAIGHELSEADRQRTLLNELGLTPFQTKLTDSGLYPFLPLNLEVFQMNLGKMCNQVCRHCHVDAGPDRKEMMTRETMESCLNVIDQIPCTTVDLTGGAPEMNPNFRWLVEALSKMGKKIIVRCNLTIIVANKKYHDLPHFYAKHGVELVSSLPYFSAMKTNSQRGEGVFDQSIKALQLLNAAGYGVPDSGLLIHLVYNPSGAFLPPSQADLREQFAKKLHEGWGIAFNDLYAITNIPMSRYLQYLITSGNYQSYMEKLVNAYNPVAAANAMCRNTLSIGWDGHLYDCDFNQMLELRVATKNEDHQHIRNFDSAALADRSISVHQHCYGCTAGAGSSCGGTTV